MLHKNEKQTILSIHIIIVFVNIYFKNIKEKKKRREYEKLAKEANPHNYMR